MKRFYKKDGKMFLQNGKSHLKVAEIEKFKDPSQPGRVSRLLVVQNVLSQSAGNPVMPGLMLAISFPEEHINRAEYKWSPKEPFQTKCKVGLHTKKRKDLEDGLEMGKLALKEAAEFSQN